MLSKYGTVGEVAKTNVMTELYKSIYSTADRVSLILWTGFCCFIGVIGNALIIFTTSFFRPTTKLDKHTKIFIRQLAISDLTYLTLRICPSFVSHVFGGWILGDNFCNFEGNTYLIPVLTSMHIILCLNLFKTLACLRPFFIPKVPVRATCVLVFLSWFLSCIVPLASFCIGVEVTVNSEIETICEPILHSVNSTSFEFGLGIVHNIQMWAPASLILPCNMMLWYLAHKHAHSHHISSHKAITTVLSISILFIVTWIPTIIEEGWRHFGDQRTIPRWFNKAHINFYFISAFGNPILYALVNRRYREETLRHIPIKRMSRNEFRSPVPIPYHKQRSSHPNRHSEHASGVYDYKRNSGNLTI